MYFGRIWEKIDRVSTHWGRDKMDAVSQTTLSNIFLKENVRISIKISLKFVPKGPINNNPALVQIMAWRRSDDKPLSEPMMVSLLRHICITRPQWVNSTALCSAGARWKVQNNSEVSHSKNTRILMHVRLLFSLTSLYFRLCLDRVFSLRDTLETEWESLPQTLSKRLKMKLPEFDSSEMFADEQQVSNHSATTCVISWCCLARRQ